MKISDVRVRLIQNESGKLRAVASITIEDNFVVHDMKVVEGLDGNLFVAMPSRKGSNGEYKDICHPLNSETRALITDAVMDVYKLELAKTITE